MLAANERDIILKRSGIIAKLVYVIKIVWEYEDKNGSNFHGFFCIVIFQCLDTVAVVNFNAVFPIYLNSLCSSFFKYCWMLELTTGVSDLSNSIYSVYFLFFISPLCFDHQERFFPHTVLWLTFYAAPFFFPFCIFILLVFLSSSPFLPSVIIHILSFDNFT